ncbi:MAG: ferritin-like domain-containing protein, partial [Myxococcota bacterium]
SYCVEGSRDLKSLALTDVDYFRVMVRNDAGRERGFVPLFAHHDVQVGERCPPQWAGCEEAYARLCGPDAFKKCGRQESSDELALLVRQGRSVRLLSDRTSLIELSRDAAPRPRAVLRGMMEGVWLSCSRYSPRPNAWELDDGWVLHGERDPAGEGACRMDAVDLRLDSDGDAEVLSVRPGAWICVGRAPSGGWSVSPSCGDRGGAAAYLAEMAQLEAAAVVAFEELERELTHHEAPASLVAEVREAAADERRHARTMGQLAERYGVVSVAVPERASVGIRGLRDIALHNVEEGCVRETWGALIGRYQAKHAGDPSVRAAMSVIAREESRHAALSWRIHDWILTRLHGDAAAEVTRHLGSLLRQTSPFAEPEPEVAALVGLPSRGVAAALDRALRLELTAAIGLS